MAMLLESPNQAILGGQRPGIPNPSQEWLDPLRLSEADESFLFGQLRTPKSQTGLDLDADLENDHRPQQTAKPRRSSRPYVSRDTVSPQRARHLERNRIAANKCRLKRKKEHDHIQSILDGESAKRECLLAEVTVLKEELWHLKNRIFEHATCHDQSIDAQLAIMSQNVLRGSPDLLECPSPTFSMSTWSDHSVDAPNPDPDSVSGPYLDDLFDDTIDTTNLL